MGEDMKKRPNELIASFAPAPRLSTTEMLNQRSRAQRKRRKRHAAKNREIERINTSEVGRSTHAVQRKQMALADNITHRAAHPQQKNYMPDIGKPLLNFCHSQQPRRSLTPRRAPLTRAELMSVLRQPRKGKQDV